MTKKQLEFVEDLVKKGIKWTDITRRFNTRYKKTLTVWTLQNSMNNVRQVNTIKKERTINDHLVIPDGQIRESVPTHQWKALAEYIRRVRPSKIINLGDFWDMPSLCAYNGKGSKKTEGVRVQRDIDVGNKVMFEFCNTIAKIPNYRPEMIFLLGNHEQRIERVAEADPKLEGIVGYHALELGAWDVKPFLEVVNIDGVAYAHYFYNHMSGKPYGGTIQNRLTKVGHSFTQGHSQELLFGRRDLSNGTAQYGLVAGAFYLHFEDYKGPQANHHWRGIIHKRNVVDGTYDPNMIEINNLLREFKP